MEKNNMFHFMYFVLSLLLCPLLPGIINKVKAFFAGRKGPSVFQLYYDLAKLVRKEGIQSTSSGGLVVLSPWVSLAALLTAAVFLPLGGWISPFAFAGDMVLFFYLMGTARASQILGAMDVGSSFEGMGASREAHFSALAETAVFAILGFLVLLSGFASTSGILFNVFADSISATGILLVVLAFFIVVITENCRVPADDPDTHLELTMIHEVMVLDHAGVDLAAVFYGGALKLWLFSSFLVLILLPAACIGTWSGSLLALAGTLLVSVLIGIVESSMARYRFLKVPQMITGALCISLLAVFFLVFF